jgi:Domain of unknown function (DUF1844)
LQTGCRPSPATALRGSFTVRLNNDIQSVCDKLTSMSTADNNPSTESTRHSFPGGQPSAEELEASRQMRDIAEVPAVEVITTAAVHLMSAAAVKCGLAAGEDADELKDLDEARKLITALAGFVTAAAPEIGSQHAGPLRDGLRSLQLAFREASVLPDEPGKGPGEKFTGPVN